LAAAAPVFAARNVPFSFVEYVSGVTTPVVTETLDVILEPAHPNLTADVYAGRGEGQRPFVVVVHGGSWRHGDKGEVTHVSRILAARGYTVFDVRYRLAPDHPFPAGIADAKCLLGRIREQAAKWKVSPTRGALLGRSAGGQMVTLMTYSAGAAAIPPSCDVVDSPPRAVISLYGAFDMLHAYENPAFPDVVDGPESIRLYLGGTPQQRAETYETASPQSWVTMQQRFPPSLLIHGDLDRLVQFHHSAVLAETLRAGNHPVDLLRVPLAEHGFDHRAGGVGEQLARHVMLRFLDDHLQ